MIWFRGSSVIHCLTGCGLVLGFWSAPGFGADLPIVDVAGQPLAANIARVSQTLDVLGRSLPTADQTRLQAALLTREAREMQAALDPHVSFFVAINPEMRVKVQRGPARASLQQHGYTPQLVKVINESGTTKSLRIVSPQSGPSYAGAVLTTLQRQAQTQLNDNENKTGAKDRFLALEMMTAPPMTPELSGLGVEYAIALIYSQDSGQREATIGFDLGTGEQDLGSRGEVPVLFTIQPAIPVQLKIRDHDGQPSVARLQFQDRQGHVYPPQVKRQMPDFFFQPQVYRFDGETVSLPPGEFQVQTSRGPEYRIERQTLQVPSSGSTTLDIKLSRWVDPTRAGFFSGDHHIHAAGCSHYTSPTEGVTPEEMFRQVKGEGLNVGCVLTWGPCYRYQRQFFEPRPHELSDKSTLLKYDIEVSGFGSQALGHVCLLNLKDQTYPGSEGTETKGWPTWTTPVMRWTKEQGGVTGYAHSGSGLEIHAENAASRLMSRYDSNSDGRLTQAEVADALLPEAFAKIDVDKDQALITSELTLSHDRVADQLPNLAIPEMNGAGAMEICVTVSEGVCDFISAMDTPRIQEWNMWYHLLNCGFPLKASGETDFPCMSSRQVGQGRVYVQLDVNAPLDYTAWCQGIAAGRSYVSDGYAHALDFQVGETRPGFGDLQLEQPGRLPVKAVVAFAPETPLAVAYGGITPPRGRRLVGDTVHLHGPRSEAYERGGTRIVELVVNGQVVAEQRVPADGAQHTLEFDLPIHGSSWIALRHFPQMHTNPINVIVEGQPIRVSRSSARWCRETIEQLWKNRERHIAAGEREAARATFERAQAHFDRLIAESPK